MTAHTAEKARKTGDFRCEGCSATVHVKKGEKIPECPCGGNAFNDRRNEPSNRSTAPSRRKKS